MASYALLKLECEARETRMKFYRAFREPKLYKYARNFEYHKIVKRCQKRPRSAAKEAVFQHEYAPNQTPLHRVLEPLFLLGKSGSTENVDELVEARHLAAAALLKAYPEAANVTCVLSTTPIAMVALDPHASIQDLDMLLMASPKSALVADLQGRVALHYACCNNRNNLCMMERLVSACPEAASVRDKLGRVPLHYAAMAGPMSINKEGSSMYWQQFDGPIMRQSSNAPICTQAVLEVLVSANKDAVSALDNANKAPLHYLCQYLESVNEEVPAEVLAMVELLLCANPRLVSMPDQEGRTPFSVLQKCHARVRARINSGALEQKLDDEALSRIMNLSSDLCANP